MAEITGMKLTLKDATNAIETVNVMKKTLKSKIGNGYDEYGYKEFENDIEVKNNIIALECTYAFTCAEHDIIKEVLLNVAREINDEFTFGLDQYSDNCGYEAFIEADYKEGILTYRFVESENMKGYCEECGESIVYFEDYDSNKEYVCPECGRVLTEEEMFPDGVPSWGVEEIKIK